MSDELEWRCICFEDLLPGELYDIMQMRNEVFVIEQQCLFQDADGIDKQCYHLCGFIKNELAVYARLIAPGIVYNEASIGRVANAKKYRGKGLGKALMQKALTQCKLLFGNVPVKIGAQYHLKNFYEGFGFTVCSDIYLEDGIKHIYMGVLIS